MATNNSNIVCYHPAAPNVLQMMIKEAEMEKQGALTLLLLALLAAAGLGAGLGAYGVEKYSVEPMIQEHASRVADLQARMNALEALRNMNWNKNFALNSYPWILGAVGGLGGWSLADLGSKKPKTEEEEAALKKKKLLGALIGGAIGAIGGSKLMRTHLPEVEPPTGQL